MCAVPVNNYAWWEEGSKQCTYPTGVTFTTHIDADAASRALYSWAGYVTNAPLLRKAKGLLY